MLEFVENSTLIPSTNTEAIGDSPMSYGHVLLQDGRRWLSFAHPLHVVVAHEAKRNHSRAQ